MVEVKVFVSTVEKFLKPSVTQPNWSIRWLGDFDSGGVITVATSGHSFDAITPVRAAYNSLLQMSSLFRVAGQSAGARLAMTRSPASLRVHGRG